MYPKEKKWTPSEALSGESSGRLLDLVEEIGVPGVFDVDKADDTSARLRKNRSRNCEE